MKATRLPLVALVLVLAAALAAPLAAFPPDCEVNCSCTTKCIALCHVFGEVMNCGTYGLCRGTCLAASDAAQPADLLEPSIFASAPAAPTPAPEPAAASAK